MFNLHLQKNYTTQVLTLFYDTEESDMQHPLSGEDKPQKCRLAPK